MGVLGESKLPEKEQDKHLPVEEMYYIPFLLRLRLLPIDSW